MDPLQWMGAVRMRVQTADKNIIIIHTTPSINVLWSMWCFERFETNGSIDSEFRIASFPSLLAALVWFTCYDWLISDSLCHVCESYLSSLSVPSLILMVWTPFSQPLSRISPTGEQRVTSRSTQEPLSDITNCTQQAICCQNDVKHMRYILKSCVTKTRTHTSSCHTS